MLATSESDGHGHTNVLGGDANLRAIHARRRPPTSATTRAARSRASRARSAASRASPSRGRAAPAARPIPPGSAAAVPDRLPRPARDDPHRLVLGRPPRPGAGASSGAGSSWWARRAHAPRRPLHAGRRRAADGGRRGPGERDLDGARRPAAALGAAHGGPARLVLLAMLAPLARWRLPLGAVGGVTVLAGVGFLSRAQLAFEGGTIIDVAAPLVALHRRRVRRDRRERVRRRRVRYRVSRDNELLEQPCASAPRTSPTPSARSPTASGVAVEWRDGETGVHIERMGRLCERLALRGRAGRREAELLRQRARSTTSARSVSRTRSC